MPILGSTACEVTFVVFVGGAARSAACHLRGDTGDGTTAFHESSFARISTYLPSDIVKYVRGSESNGEHNSR
jgi:hypothetical protein